MNKEKILDKMVELRNKRDFEILENNLYTKSKEDLKNNKVLNVKYLGKVEISEEIDGKLVKNSKDMYLLIEQIKDKDGNLIQVEKYYTEDFKFVGANKLGDGFELSLDEKYMYNEKLLNNLKQLNHIKALDLNKMENDRIKEIANILGIEDNEIEKMVEIDKEKLKFAEKKLDNKDEDKKYDSNKEELTKEEVGRVSTKADIKTNQKINDKETIESVLGVQNKGYIKISVIFSDKLKDKSNTGKFAFVGIKSDGSAEKIDGLEQDYGSVPTKQVYSLNNDGSEIEKRSASTIYRIKGQKEKQLAVGFGLMGNIEPSLIRTPRGDNTKGISIPIETNTIRPTTRETRELMNEGKNPRVNEEIERAEEHEKHNCKEWNIKDINDNPNDDTHKHIEFNDESIDKWVDYIMEDEEIAFVFTNNEVKEMLLNYWDSNADDDEQKIQEQVDNIKQKIEQDANNFDREK